MQPQDEIFSSQERLEMFQGMELEQLAPMEPSSHSNSHVDYYTYYQNNPQKSIFEQFGFLTDNKSSSFEKMSQHCKSINGLQGFVTLAEQTKSTSAFDQPEDLSLQKFFAEPEPTDPLQKNISILRSVLNSNSSDLVQNFEKYLYVQEESKQQFFESFKTNYFQMLKQCSKKKRADSLLHSIVDFWINSMREMLLAIQECSPLYTSNLFKKEKEGRFVEMEEESVLTNRNIDKKKLWSADECRRLEQVMSKDVQISSSTINQLALELGRSTVAVQTKIQKMQRQKRTVSYDLEKKVLGILKSSVRGLTKQEIFQALKAKYKTSEQNFKKNVCPLLSDSQHVLKIRGVYTLKSPVRPKQQINNFKDKVIHCMMDIREGRADLKTITRKYMQKFSRSEGIYPQDGERVKALQANISKTLHKYDVFDTSQSKTIYRFKQVTEEGSMLDSSDMSESETKARM